MSYGVENFHFENTFIVVIAYLLTNEYERDNGPMTARGTLRRNTYLFSPILRTLVFTCEKSFFLSGQNMPEMRINASDDAFS